MSGPSPLPHNEYVAVLGSLPPVRLLMPLDDGLSFHSVPFVVDMRAVAERLLILENRLQYDITWVNAEVMHWGRLAAMAHRSAQVAARRVRVWKAQVELKVREEVEGMEEAPKGLAALIESRYRTASDYGAVEGLEDSCQETWLVLKAIHEAFQSKARNLNGDVYRARDGSLQQRSY